jgi:hypothetical protein
MFLATNNYFRMWWPGTDLDTASGAFALTSNTSRTDNTADSAVALNANTTGNVTPPSVHPLFSAIPLGDSTLPLGTKQ